MAIYNYGIGGNEVKVDANESIAEIPSNRTLIASNPQLSSSASFLRLNVLSSLN
jgi:hypothetical protein